MHYTLMSRCERKTPAWFQENHPVYLQNILKIPEELASLMMDLMESVEAIAVSGLHANERIRVYLPKCLCVNFYNHI